MMRSSFLSFGLGLMVCGGLTGGAYADMASADAVPLSLAQQISPIGDQDSSLLPASGVSTPVSLTQRNLPQDLPVEAVPTPTAVTSGLIVLAAMAGVRVLRRLKRA
jgi:hypothetical protein